MKADQQFAQHFKSPDKTTKPRLDKKRESIPAETESSQKSLLDTQQKKMTNNHSTLEFSNTKE